MYWKVILIVFLSCIAVSYSMENTYEQEWSVSINELNGRENRAIVIDESGNIWFGTRQGLVKYDGNEWEYLTVADGLVNAKVTGLSFDENGKMWVATEGGVSIFNNGEWVNITIIHGLKGNSVQTVASLGATAWAGTASGANHIDENGAVIDTQLDGENIQAIAVDSHNNVWFGTTTGLYKFDGSSWEQFTSSGTGELLSDNIRGLAFDQEGTLWIATSKGVNALSSSGEWSEYTGREGLGCENVYSVVMGTAGIKWFVTEFGIAKLTVEDEWDWYMTRRWLPAGVPLAVAVSGDGTVWFGGGSGANKLVTEEFTFEKKAQFFEERIRSRHFRLGLVAESGLAIAGDLSSNYTHDLDNDGLWTGIYVAAEAFRYAVTGDEEAKQYAKTSFDAMVMLQTVTDGVVPKEGFFARSYVPYNAQLGTDSKWHHSADGQWTWKGTTSSDELVGHMFAYYIYFELVADEEEKVRVRNHVSTIMNHVVDNDLVLIDYDGNHTRWGVWRPSILNGMPVEKSLNSLQILSFLKVAHHITGDAKFDSVYHHLIDVENYDQNTINVKYLDEINHSDDELAFLSYYPLLQLEQDPGLRNTYLGSIDRSWFYEEPERSSLFNFIYHSAYPDDPEEGDDASALTNLRLWPMDLITWSFDNSIRDDIDISPERGRFGELQSLEVLPVDQRPAIKWNANPYRLIEGGSGRGEQSGSEWLLPFWMGRYHGYIQEGVTAVLDREDRLTPEGFLLSQNYPNPFNPSTIIHYQLPGKGFVELGIYNTLGQKIVTLVSEEQTAGFHKVEFNGHDLASGVYLYRISVGNWHEVKKMVFLK